MLSAPMPDRFRPRGVRSLVTTLLACCVAGGTLLALGAVRPVHAQPAAPAPALEAGPQYETMLASLAAPGNVFALPGSLISPGANSKPHESFDTTTGCTKCHDSGAKSTTNKLCTAAGCHDADIAKHQASKQHFHGSQLVLSKNCGECHNDHQGVGFNMIDDKSAHATINGVQNTSASAWGVAMQNANGSKSNWNHDLTGYKLIGGHKIGNTQNNIDCDNCHKPGDKRPNSATRTWLGLREDCLSCHANYHNFSKGDRFEDCLICHTFTNWDKKFNLTGFNHDKETKFALNGAHNQVGCAECHAKGKPFAPVPHDTCETCHAGDSIHGKTFTTQKCVYCHTDTTWKKERDNIVTAQHKNFAKFDAVGAHKNLGCAQCHKGLKTTPPKAAEDENNCAACHNNIHGEKWMANQPKGCVRCHSNVRWTPVSVENKDHKDFSKWGLTGGDGKPAESKHMPLDCVRCHLNLVDVPANHECITCHLDWHATAASGIAIGQPPRKVQSRGAKCTDCHNTTLWEQPGVDHDKTRFPLTGKHREVGCEQCHKDYATTKSYKHDTACNSCHGDPHLGKLPKTCEKCHDTATWEDEKFDHNKDAQFKLIGRHLAVDCYKCHLDLGFRDTPDGCSQCHSDYHKGAWGPIECDQCHNERRWNVERGTLVFETLHNFGEVVLTGMHTQLQCETCHAPNPRWLMNGMGGECNQCHPDVHMGGRGQECHTCHNQRAWLPAEFNHASTGFPLSGTHRLVGCVECHRGNIYTGTPDECMFCHSDDAQQIHGLCDDAGDCQRCHNTVRWSGTGGALPPCDATQP